jgi:hypothetical protein
MNIVLESKVSCDDDCTQLTYQANIWILFPQRFGVFVSGGRVVEVQAPSVCRPQDAGSMQSGERISLTVLAVSPHFLTRTMIQQYKLGRPPIISEKLG